MIKLICIIISLPLIYSTKRQYNDEPKHPSMLEKMNKSYTSINNHTSIENEREHYSKDKISLYNTDIKMVSEDNSKTNHDLFEIPNESILGFDNVINDLDLDVDINPDLFDVSSFVLTDYFELYPDELERILNGGSDNLNEESCIDKGINESNTFPSEKILEGSLSKNINWNLTRKCNINYNEEDTNERLNDINPIILSEYIESFKVDIKKYIEFNISKAHQVFYIRKLESISYIINLLDEYQQKFKENINFSAYDQELEKSLELICKKFKDNRQFDQKTYNSFMEELNLHTCEEEKLHYHKCILLSKKKGDLKYYFEFLKLYEFIKLYRHVYDVPEIMTIGRLFKDNLYKNDPTFILHICNVFFEKIDKQVKNKVFIKCLVYKAFSYSSKFKLDFFLVPKFYKNCRINHENLYFFLWEVHSQFRERIKRKTKTNYSHKFSYTEIQYMKVVILLLLYQHTIMLKCHFTAVEDINVLTDFGKRIINTKECIMCIFDDFLNLIRSQIDKLKY